MNRFPILTTLVLVSVICFATVMILSQSEFNGTTIHLAGDSTMAVQAESKRPDTGWGEPFALMVCNNVRVVNSAKNGRSTKSFLTEGHWQNLLNRVEAEDVVLIQFGHNDQKTGNTHLYASAWSDYSVNLRRFITDVRSKDATPILLTSIVRRSFDRQEKLQQTLGDYPTALRSAADEMQALMIDLNQMSHRAVEELGSDTSRALYVHLEPGAHKNFPNGKQDNTHLSPRGALMIAKLAAAELRTMRPRLICR